MQLIATLFLAAAVVNAVPTPKLDVAIDRIIARADDRLAVARTEKAGKAGATEEAEAEPANKLDLQSQFDTPTELQGGDIQQDTTFPPGVVGLLEVEFANADGRTLTVKENKTPAAPPAGFTALEPSSYQIQLSGGSADGLTVSKVDYIRNADSTVDISQGQIGRLCTETNTFVIDPAVGELEFEAEENELSMKVANMNAEWGIFLPTAAAAPAGDSATGGTTGGATTTGNAFIDLLMSLLTRGGTASA